ncbi:MAG: hypothetical protein CM1200mP27_10360 [Chloroflexota bacterium]|nr:MAG: hypothetical protein CM1200mP27_10360 [Chloroflexota bacterium]
MGISPKGHFAIRDFTALALWEMPVSKVKVCLWKWEADLGKLVVYVDPVAAMFKKKPGRPVK